MKTHSAKIRLKDGAVPKFHRARPVPYALKPKVDVELYKLIEQGVLVPVSYAE